MATSNAAKFYANLTRELFVLEAVVGAGSPPDFAKLQAEASGRPSNEVSADITDLQRRIKAARDANPITRWVDADPEHRDGQPSWTN
ncbi:hypothetical protein PJN93_30000, partial [Mycobacterium kansasii]